MNGETRTSRLGSPLFGLDRGRTLVGIGVLSLLVASLLAAKGVPAVVLTSDSHRFALWLFNGFTGVVLFSILAATPVAILYGLWNGGPILAGSLPVAPVVVAHLLGGQFTVSLDLSLALAGGSIGAVAATIHTWLYALEHQDAGPETYSTTIAVGTATTAGGVAATVVSLWQLDGTAGNHLQAGLLVTEALVLFAVGGLCLVALLTAVPDLPSRIGVTSRHR